METLLKNLSGKTLLKYLLVCVTVGLMFTSTVNAQIRNSGRISRISPLKNQHPSNAGLQVMVNQMESSLKFRVQFEEYTNKPVRVLIQEQKGRIVFSQLFYKAKYIGRFDLSGVKEGTYHFVISSDTETYKQSFHIQNISLRMVTKAEDYPPLVQRTK
jgi:hypothetical protein